MARVHNALLAAKEFKDAKDEFKLIFDGAGTKWIKECAMASQISLSEEYEGHPSFRELIAEGYQIITF